MPHCAAYLCFNSNRKKKDGVTFHRFPKNPELRLKWIQAVNRENWNPSNYSYLCSEHFLERDFDKTSLSCVRLRDGTVPCNFPGNKKKLIVERHPPKKRNIEAVTEDNTASQEIKCNIASNSSPIKKQNVSDNVTDTPRKKLLKTELQKTKKQLFGMRKKVKILNQSKRRLKKKIANLEDIVKTLQDKMHLGEESCNLLTSLSKNSECLVKRAIEKTKNPGLKKVYEERLKGFAITLHFISPKAYSFIRKTFDTALPHPRTLHRWYSCVNGEPGFSNEVLRALKEYSDKSSNDVICSLLIDAMAIRKHLEWDGKRFHGSVNVGTAPEDDSSVLATEVLVFHLVFINSAWKIPLGYFFVCGLSGAQLAGLVKQALLLVADTGVTIGSLTCDGTASNISMANILGCKITHENMVTTFPNPSTGNDINFFLDVSHMLKLVRNTLGDYGVLIDDNNERVDWNYIKMLQELQEREELRLGNKLTKHHIQYYRQKMKVKLAAQVLSNSVADALEYLQSNKVTGFDNCQATIRFIRNFNRLFDTLNSRSIRNVGDKKALCIEHLKSQHDLLDEASSYIRQLKDLKGLPILITRRKTGFLGLLVNIHSAKNMFKQFVGIDKPLKYLPLYKVSQDHLERLFGYIRSRGGCNNNPTCKQFTGTFKRLLLHSELHEGSRGNAEILDRSLMFKVCKRSDPLVEINSSTTEWRLLDDEDKEISLDNSDINDNIVIFDNLSCDVVSDIVEYIAGFVVKSITPKLLCQNCVNELTTESSHEKSLIYFKNRGGLIHPSPAVTRICRISEKILKSKLITGKVITNKNFLRELKMSVFKSCLGVELFNSTEHFNCSDPESNHFFLLIELVCLKYFNIRLRYHGKVITEKTHMTKIRNDLCKKILFAGQ